MVFSYLLSIGCIEGKILLTTFVHMLTIDKLTLLLKEIIIRGGVF